MSEFKYQEPFPLGKDETKYRLLTKEYVSVEECCGRRILRVDPRGLELLAREAFADAAAKGSAGAQHNLGEIDNVINQL